ncbi:MAG: glycerol-3-phosphate dehydrogenase/oxidase [Bacteroidota bacterium]
MATTWRTTRISQFSEEDYDLVVIGGGATGCGIALDAVTRGLKTALIEKNDFASGTSSRSTKLIHGGLRYLKQFEISLVRETGSERAIVHKLAPHLVVPEKMLLPIIENGTYSKSLTSLGLKVYDVLAGVKKEDRRKMLNKAQTLEKEPLLNPTVVKGGGYYAEYRTDDARLSLELIKTAVQKGVHAANYVEGIDFIYGEVNGEKKIRGIICQDSLTQDTFQLKAKQIINAAGPWVDELRKTNQSLSGKHLHLTKGVHIVLPHVVFPVRQSVYFDSPDGRMIFAIPRGKITYVGTTDTDYKGDKHHPRTTQEDIAYLLQAVNHLFPGLDIQKESIISSWAGLRPLVHEEGKSASEISRKDEIFFSESGLISIAGGKLTGYRKMGQRVVNAALKAMDRKHVPSKTHRITLCGGEFDDFDEVKAFKEALREKLSQGELPDYYADYLVGNYGKQVVGVLSNFEEQDEADKELALLLAELQFAIEKEMVLYPTDFFIRRTGRLYFDIESVYTYKLPIIRYFAQHFAWSEQELQEAENQLDRALTEASTFPPEQQEKVLQKVES